MTTHKDFKRLVRGRMQKTGEPYTAARAHLLKPKPAVTPRNGGAGEYAKLAGKSDAIIKQRTGCDWARWVKALDHAKAHTWPHREIARYVHQKYEIPSWWAQTITVGYERIKGLRAIGQRRDGSFEASKSKTFAVPLPQLYRAFHDPRTRSRWLPEMELMVRTATRDKSMRITWPDGTSVEVGFTSRGAAKSQVTVQHTRLANQVAASRMKEFWSQRLDALGEVVGNARVGLRRH